MDLEILYQGRFGDSERRRKEVAWREIARYLRRFIPPESSVLDVGCDRGYFIRNIRARERWATDVRDMRPHLPGDINFVRSDALSLASAVPRRFDRIFISNLLEHLRDGEQVVEVLRCCATLLDDAGRLLILQPNIKLIGSAYWDFLDHRVPLTEVSLEEALLLAGLKTETLMKRFLPYSTKSRLPVHALLVRAYLALPPARYLFGKQSLVVARKRLDT